MKLRCIKGPYLGEEIFLESGQEYIFGRSPTQPDVFSIELSSPTVSKEHAKIYDDQSQWLVKDLESKNGIRINRQPVQEAYLSPGDEIDIGEFRFVFEGDEDQVSEPEFHSSVSDGTDYLPNASPKNSLNKKNEFILKVKRKLNSLEFYQKLFGLLIIASVVGHTIVFTALQQEARKRIFTEAFKKAELIAANVAQNYASNMAEQTYHLVDCTLYRDRLLRQGFEIKSLIVLNPQAESVCPVGVEIPKTDYLIQQSLKTNEIVSNCYLMLGDSSIPYCQVMAPIRFGANSEVVGYSRLTYVPTKAFIAMERFSSLRWQTLGILLLLFISVGWLIRVFVKRGVFALTEELQLLNSGAMQKVENIKNFAALEPIISEVNRLNYKENQALKADEAIDPGGAGFLQPLIQQVFLLEERAVIAVDSDNNILAFTEGVQDLVPFHEDPIGQHITQGVADTHLQSDLMGLLNDLAMSGEFLDRSLSLSDRVIHSQGMPLYLNGEYVASLIILNAS